ncbi:MAG: hypothetical protein GXP55_25765, partial [Deltaproteobacteria bacterium]|nr:hypothetical protein [Deltaproteobacteria bacterium]
MTAPKHDCAATREQLLDLLSVELDAAESAIVRAAAEGCPECAAELATLEDGLRLAAALPMEELSANFDQRVMARVHQELAGAAAETKSAPVTDASGLLPGLVRRLRDLLAGPQVAMATLTLLVAAL